MLPEPQFIMLTRNIHYTSIMRVSSARSAVRSDLLRDQRIQRRLCAGISFWISATDTATEVLCFRVSEVVNLLPRSFKLCVPTAFLTNDDQR